MRVLIVDDSAFMRRAISQMLASDPDIQVIGTARNGREGLDMAKRLEPDVITLDIEMPEMDGLTTLRAIRKTHPRLPVVMFSALTERGAADTLEALHIGASDYVTKPSSTAGKAVAQQRISQDLVPKIRSLCRVGVGTGSSSSNPVAASAPKPFSMRALGTPMRADVVAIGVSTGGPNALATVLSALPADFPAPIVLVQHMQNMFTRFLAERLSTQTSLNVVEASNGQVLQSGTVYVAPGDFHLTVRRQSNQVVTVLGQEPPENSHRPAADVLFRSIAEVYGSRALGLVLTGMGEDGRKGSEEINRAGGRVIVQDEASSVVWEMAGRIASAGLADAVLPLNALAGELIRRTGRPSTTAA